MKRWTKRWIHCVSGSRTNLSVKRTLPERLGD
jgi:hypothetical protein